LLRTAGTSRHEEWGGHHDGVHEGKAVPFALLFVDAVLTCPPSASRLGVTPEGVVVHRKIQWAPFLTAVSETEECDERGGEMKAEGTLKKGPSIL